MRHLLNCLLLACAGSASAQAGPSGPASWPDFDPDLMRGGPLWLVGDHVNARHHFRSAALRGHPLGQYNLAMMLLHREGGPCGSAEAAALLHKAAGAGVAQARDALAQMQDRGAAHKGLEHPFPCPWPSRSPSTPAVGLLQPAAAR